MKAPKMSKTRFDLESNDFWSANKFKNQGTALLNWLENSKIPFKLGRSCIHIGTIKLYPHWNGRSNDFVSLVKGGVEVAVFNKTCKIDDVIEIIKKHF
jgi:hypothetical protein